MKTATGRTGASWAIESSKAIYVPFPGVCVFFCFFGYAGFRVISNAYWFRVVSLGSCVFISSAFILGIVIRPSLFIFV